MWRAKMWPGRRPVDTDYTHAMCGGEQLSLSKKAAFNRSVCVGRHEQDVDSHVTLPLLSAVTRTAMPPSRAT